MNDFLYAYFEWVAQILNPTTIPTLISSLLTPLKNLNVLVSSNSKTYSVSHYSHFLSYFVASKLLFTGSSRSQITNSSVVSS